ncbi:MAG: PBP1A family penicillin-binding protein [Patescibacteria group bacterium]
MINISVKKLSNFLFYVFYLIVQFFITVGEFAQKILLFPYYVIHSIAQTIPSFSVNKPEDILITQRKTTSLKFTTFTQLFAQFMRMLFFLLTLLSKLFYRIAKEVFSLFFQTVQKTVSIILWIVLLPYKLFMAFFSREFRFLILGFIICAVIFVVYQSYQFVISLPSPKKIGSVNYAQSTHLYDRNGKLLYEIYRDENRTPVKLKDLPAFVKQATVAIEDRDFFKHNGVSLTSGILRALKETILTRSLQGGSTITQQLVKSSLLTSERTIERKIKEILLALWTEKLFSKEEILEMYLNQVPYGGSSYGIEEASKTFFGKYAKDLSLEEAALLASLPMSPSFYSPYINPEYALNRRNEVLKKMNEQGYIDRTQREIAQNTTLQVQPLATSIHAPHFVFHVKSGLEERYGERIVEEGGLRVKTTLDLEIQEQTEQILKEELEKIKALNVTNGAVLITKPATGEIIAMVGSVDYFAEPSGAFNVTTALRQPGSSIKPLMYSLALEKDFTAASILDDSPVSFSVPGGQAYKPVNYDGRYHGRVPLRYALANSFNITAVKTLSAVGVDSFVNHAKKMGITSWNDSERFGLSLTLGGGEVHMTDMAVAYGVFANGGHKVDLTNVIRIQDTGDKLLYEMQPSKKKVLDEGVAYIMSDILSDNFARRWAFGSNSMLEIPGYKVAVKTGTTDQKKDNWTIGYTPEFLVAVWVGNNDNSPMDPQLASGVTGAAPIWNRVMTNVLIKRGNGDWMQKPVDVLEKTCFFGKPEYFIKGTEQKASCSGTSMGVSPMPTINQ